MPVNLIAAVGRRGQLGLAGKLPWHAPEDLAWFRQMTMDKTVICGGRTAQSLPPLPGRHLYVMERGQTPENVIKMFAGSDIWVIGGAETYKQWLPFVDRVYLSRIDYDGEADTWMPALWGECGDGPGEEDGPWAPGWEERAGQVPCEPDPSPEQWKGSPLACDGLNSYRYRGRYGWVMIGAKDADDAMREAARSTDNPVIDNLEVWNGTEYVSVRSHSAQVLLPWTATKPTVPGAYWIRGFELSTGGGLALVEVAPDEDGPLVTNLHCHNSDRNLRNWDLVESISEEFEWQGPLLPGELTTFSHAKVSSSLLPKLFTAVGCKGVKGPDDVIKAAIDALNGRPAPGHASPTVTDAMVLAWKEAFHAPEVDALPYDGRVKKALEAALGEAKS